MITIIGNDNLDDVSNPAPVDTEEDDFEEGVALTVEELVFLALHKIKSKIHDWIEVDNDFVDVNLETEEDDFEEGVDLTVEELLKRESKIYDCIEVDNDLVDDNLEKVKNWPNLINLYLIFIKNIRQKTDPTL